MNIKDKLIQLHKQMGYGSFDPYLLADNTKEWPKIDGEYLDSENWYIETIDEDKLTIVCGGDWQDPHKVDIGFNGKLFFVYKYFPTNYNENDGIDIDKILEFNN